MSEIILDISANTHKNDWNYLKRMLDELKAVDTGKHEIIIKHQLFVQAGENIPLYHDIFDKAYKYAAELGYKTTSSVFDLSSLNFLLRYDIPFVKIANNRDLYWLIDEVPRKVEIYVSVGNDDDYLEFEQCEYYRTTHYNTTPLCCVSKYPCDLEDYLKAHETDHLIEALSDHTTNFDLFNKYKPDIVEWHYKLPDSTGLDAGDFARTPEQLSKIL